MSRYRVWTALSNGKICCIKIPFSGHRSNRIPSPVPHAFQKVPGNQLVRTANRAYDAGRLFDLAGKIKNAAEFYELCISWNTGSGRDMLARYRLAIMDKDFLRAARHSYSVWSRYSSFESLGNFLSIMSMAGGSDDLYRHIRQLFQQYHNSGNTAELWWALYTDHRLQGSTLDGIEKDAALLMPVSASTILKGEQRRYIFRQAYIDRPFTIPNARRIHQYTPPTKEKTSSQEVRPSTDKVEGTGEKAKEPTRLKEIFSALSGCPDGSCEDEMKQLTGMAAPDKYAHFYLGLHYMKTKEIQKAVDIFLYYDKRFRLLELGPYSGFALPYAIMGFMEHDRSTPEMFAIVKKRLTHGGEKSKNFGRDLTMALLSAYDGDKVQSLDYLKHAVEKAESFDAKNQSPATWYQLVDTLEWLYHYSKDEDYLMVAMRWAKLHQSIHPGISWAYAFEALHGEISRERIRAAGFAQYLDQKSQWLSRVPEHIRHQGTEWWEKQDMFSPKKEKEGDSQNL